MEKINSIYWFRNDLRINDNPGLKKAFESGTLLPIFILNDESAKEFKIGKNSRIALYEILKNLNSNLNDNLNFYIGTPEKIIKKLCEKYKIENVFYSNRYEPWEIEDEINLEKELKNLKINFEKFNSAYLWNPEEIKKNDNTYYKVFTAYKKKTELIIPRKSLNNLKIDSKKIKFDDNNKTKIDNLDLIKKNNYEKNLLKYHEFGENVAEKKLHFFVKNKLKNYKINRDFPSLNNVSNLSISLHFGEISPYYIWHYIKENGLKYAEKKDIDHFISEITWREFSIYLVYNFKKLHFSNFQEKFNKFKWSKKEKLLNSWKNGETGYPIIDAGMRELNETGNMHNRIRLIVASFLTKNLMIHWHEGRDYFWDLLLDADLGNNSCAWQWVAGCGVDAAPFFRIFNPITQAKKFDSDGKYIKKYIPELSKLPDKYLFAPWETPEEILKQINLKIGKDYPNRIIDFNESRKKALDDYKNLKY